jgi:hypothetical protein
MKRFSRFTTMRGHRVRSEQIKTDKHLHYQLFFKFFLLNYKIVGEHKHETYLNQLPTTIHEGRGPLAPLWWQMVVVVTGVVVVRQLLHDLGFLFRLLLLCLLVLHFIHLQDLGVADLLAQTLDQADGVDVVADHLQPVLAVSCTYVSGAVSTGHVESTGGEEV